MLHSRVQLQWIESLKSHSESMREGSPSNEDRLFYKVLNQDQMEHSTRIMRNVSETNHSSDAATPPAEPLNRQSVSQLFVGLDRFDNPMFTSNDTMTSELQTSGPSVNCSRPRKRWTYEEDELLRSLVLVQHEFDWNALGKALQVTRQEVVRRWQESIYPKLKVENKVAGALRWSAVEDSILIEAVRKVGEEWEFIVGFLPSRSKFSTEGRWRRLTKSPVLFEQFEGNQGRESKVDLDAMSKYQYRKHVIRQIGARLEAQ